MQPMLQGQCMLAAPYNWGPVLNSYATCMMSANTHTHTLATTTHLLIAGRPL